MRSEVEGRLVVSKVIGMNCIWRANFFQERTTDCEIQELKVA